MSESTRSGLRRSSTRALFETAAESGAARGGDAALHARLAIAMHQVFLARWLETDPRPSADEVGDAIWATLERTFLTGTPNGTEERR